MNSKNWKISKDMLVIEQELHWDNSFAPELNETTLSWFSRIAKSNAADPIELFNIILPHHFIEWYYKIDSDTSIRRKLLSEIRTFIPDKITPEFQYIDFSKFMNDYLFGYDTEIKYCRICLGTDKVPYFRYIWQLKSIYCCIDHKVVLETKCPGCLTSIEYWKTGFEPSLLRCWSCSQEITQSWIEPRIVKPDVIEMQRSFLLFYQEQKLSVPIKPKELDDFTSNFFMLMLITLQMDKEAFILKFTQSSFSERLEILTKTYNLIDATPSRLSNPYHCKLCDNEYSSLNELNQDICHLPTKIAKIKKLYENTLRREKTPDDVAIFRFEVVNTLINQGTTARSVMEMARTLDIGASTIWTWIRKYKESNDINELKNKYNKSGRKAKFSKTIMNSYTEKIEDLHSLYPMKQIYQDHTKELKREFGTSILLPSYSTVRRYFLRNKVG